jgi:hypothetical protein
MWRVDRLKQAKRHCSDAETHADKSRRIAPEIIRSKEGAVGEQRVGDRLAKLSSFVRLYDRQFVGRGGNIDAIAIGPPGIFAIEVKNWRGSIEIVNGRLKVRGRDQAQLVGKTIELAQFMQATLAPDMNRHRLQVVPVLRFVGKRVKGADRVGGLHVVGDIDLDERLRREPPVLTGAGAG